MPITIELDETGELFRLPVPNPIAGQEVDYTLPAGYVYDLLSVALQYVSSPVILDRWVSLEAQKNAVVAWRSSPWASFNNNVTRWFMFAQGLELSNFTLPPGWTMPLPVGHRLVAGDRLRTVTGPFGMDLGDQWTVLSFWVRRWLAP